MEKGKRADYYWYFGGLVFFSLLAIFLLIEGLNFIAGSLIVTILINSLLFLLYKIFSPNRGDLRKVGLLSLGLGIVLGLINYEFLRLISLSWDNYLTGALVLFPMLIAVIHTYIELGAGIGPGLVLKRVTISSIFIDLSFLGAIWGLKIAI